jgi:hypothetical protein
MAFISYEWPFISLRGGTCHCIGSAAMRERWFWRANMQNSHVTGA